MKKLAIFLAIMLIPFTAFALDTISDNDLNEVTGQAGVSIYTNSIQIVKTGVTTTYTDADDVTGDQVVNIVDEGSTTSIFFRGIDPLMIDIVDMQTLADTISAHTSMLMDSTDYGDSAIQITLPDQIDIVNEAGATKTYYTGAVAANNRLIGVTITGGTTSILSADPGWAHAAGLTSGYHHDDQIKILITAHTDIQT